MPQNTNHKAVHPSQSRFIWSFVLTAIVLVGAFFGARIYVDYTRTIRAAEDRLLVQTRVVDENLNSNLTSINLMINNIINKMAVTADKAQLNDYLKHQLASTAGIRTLMINDQQGRCIYSNRDELLNKDFSNRDYFKTSLDATDKEMLLLSPPFKTLLKKYAITITKPLFGKQGEFRGFVTATLEPDYFAMLLKSTIYAPDNRVSLVHSDGTVFIAVPEAKVAVTGVKLNQPGSVFLQHLNGGNAVSIRRGSGKTIGDKRIFAYRTNAPQGIHFDKHIVVAASRNMQDVLAEWRIDSGIESTIFLLFAILSIVITKKMLQRGNELKQLEESLSRLAAIVEFSDDAIISKDLDGFILSWNAGAVRLFGYSPNEAIGELISILIPFELQDEENRILQSLKAGEPVSDLETVRIARDGRRIDVSVTSSPLKDTIGRVIGASKIIRDITDHKRTEDALKESEFFFKESQRAASIGSYKTDLITGKCEISEVLSGIFGLVSDSILYLQEWLKMIHPDDRDMMDQYLREEVVAKRNIFSKEYRIIRQNDGETRWVLGLGELKFDDDDIPVTLIGTIQDITARKEAERSILRAKREWERTFDSIPDMIAIIDKDHLITRANKALAQHMGLSVEECIGQPCYSNVHCSDHPPAFCPHVFTMADGGQHEVEIYEKRLGGDFLVTTSPLFDEQERMIGSVHIARDITERKQIENILRFLGQCGSTESGEDFFHELARYLASALMMDFVCIDRLEEDRLSAETLAVFHNGQFEDNVTYTLKDTPCGDVVGKNVCSFPKNVCGLFPNDQVLQDLQAESYLGTTLWSAQGKPIGLIAVIGRHPLEDTRLGESVLQLVAVRAAGELERLQTEEQIKNQMKELQRFNKELIRFNKIAVGRELRMIELKKVINEMCANAGLPKRYDLDINGDQP